MFIHTAVVACASGSFAIMAVPFRSEVISRVDNAPRFTLASLISEVRSLTLFSRVSRAYSIRLRSAPFELVDPAAHTDDSAIVARNERY